MPSAVNCGSFYVLPRNALRAELATALRTIDAIEEVTDGLANFLFLSPPADRAERRGALRAVPRPGGSFYASCTA